jgi:hypothetical protein
MDVPSQPAWGASGLQRWNTLVSDWKPLLVAAAGTIYVAGYVARAAVAWEYSLGILPALDFQYFVAGLILVSPLAVLWAVYAGVRELLRRLVRWERANSKGKSLDAALTAIFLVSALLFALATLISWIGLSDKFAMPLLFGMLGAFLLMISINIVRDDFDRQNAGSEAAPTPPRGSGQRPPAAAAPTAGVIGSCGSSTAPERC